MKNERLRDLIVAVIAMLFSVVFMVMSADMQAEITYKYASVDESLDSLTEGLTKMYTEAGSEYDKNVLSLAGVVTSNYRQISYLVQDVVNACEIVIAVILATSCVNFVLMLYRFVKKPEPKEFLVYDEDESPEDDWRG